MSKFTLATLLLLSAYCTSYAYDPIHGKIRHFSISITNPLSAASKIGGVAEMRLRLSALEIGFTNYMVMSAYPGKQYKLEYLKFINTWRRNEFFWYLKILGGNSTYKSENLSFLGDKTNTTVGPVDYYGGGAGMGYRFNFNKFILTVNGGLKYVALPENLPDQQRDNFRIFYATGPGSIIDFNFKLGYQFGIFDRYSVH